MSVASLASGVLGRVLKLPPPVTRSVGVRRDVAIIARDGTALRTDHYRPRLPAAPAVLIRTPYGRGGVSGLLARVLAERGYHVVVQSCRGTGGSGGTFAPLRYEREDGQDTVAWLREEPWFTGRLGTFGPSYLGFTQWAIADTPELAAMATIVTASDFRDPTYAGESFSLASLLTWATLLEAQEGPWLAGAVDMMRGQPRLRQGLDHLPLISADEVATGRQVSFFREWLDSFEPDHEYWAGLGHHHRIPEVTAPVLMVGGWHDIFLPWQLRDYAALRAAGARPRLTIGPWTHGSAGLFGASLRESLDWFGTHLRGVRPVPPASPVRVYLGGRGRWLELADWPPPGATTEPWFLGLNGGLDRTAPALSTTDTIRYDPADPTPAVGGPVLTAKLAGPRDNRALEARPDVLVYSSAPLTEPLTVVGPVTATIYVRADRPYFDVFVRLCDVRPGGRSTNVCDGLTRVRPEVIAPDTDEVFAVTVRLWPAAHEFAAGHSVRVQVSGGAHPLYARNPGTGEPLGSAVELRPVLLTVHHGGDRPSAIYFDKTEITQ